MQTVSLRRISVSSSFAFVALVLLWLTLLPGGAAQSFGPAKSIEPRVQPAAVITDTRWLNLITSLAPQDRSSASTATLNLHLTDQIAAGQVASSAMVYISVTQGSAALGYWQVAPFPTGGTFMYVAALPCYGSMTTPAGGGPLYCTYLLPGNVVWVTQAGSTMSLTVPALTALADTRDDEVYGIAPISQSVIAYLYPFTTPDVPYTHTAQADASGVYRASFTPTLDVRPRDSGYVMFNVALDEAVYVRFVAPQLRALVGGQEVAGYAAPNSLVAITATQTDGTPRASTAAYTALDGRFSTVFYNAAALQPNEQIVATAAGQTISMTVMTLTTQIDLASGLVSGVTLPNQPLEVERMPGPLSSSSYVLDTQTALERVMITATASGQYSATLALARPNFGFVSLDQPDGNQTVAKYVVPYVDVRLGGHGTYADYYAVTGQIGEGSAPITLTIQGASGYAKDVRAVTTLATGYFYDYAQTLSLAAGDVLTVTSPYGVQAVFVAPELTGQIDPDADVISGTAPSNAVVTLLVNSYQLPMGGGGPPSGYGYTTIVTADAQGRYQANLHGVIDLTSSSTGEAQVTTSDGHRATRALDALPTGGCLVRLTDAPVNGNTLNLMITGNCQQYGQINVRLRAPNGDLEAERIIGWYSFYCCMWPSIALFDSTGFPIAIAPRDSIELEWSDWATLPTPTPTPTTTPSPTPWPVGSRTPWTRSTTQPARADTQFQSYTVPTLTAQLNLMAKTIEGEAPPNVALDISVYQRYFSLFITTTADAQGHYNLDVSSLASLTAEALAQVSWHDGRGTRWYAYGIAPLFKATIGNNRIEVQQPSLTPITLTIQPLSGAPWTMARQIPVEGALSLDAPYVIGAGDRLTLMTPQTVTTLIVPELSAQVDRATAAVYGRAPAGAALQVDLIAPVARTQSITATASGQYTATFAGLAPLTYAYGTLTYLDGAVKQVAMDFSTGRWTVPLDETCTDVVAEMAGRVLTVTLESPPGIVREVITHTVGYGNQFTACFNRTIKTGDRLVLAYPSGVSGTITLPTLTARHAYAQQAVLGQAPAGMPIEVMAYDRSTVRRVWSDAHGTYGVDFSDHPLAIGTLGRVNMTDAAGNIIIRRFTVTGLTRYLPLMLK